MDPGNTLVRAAWVIAVVGYPLALPATDCNGNGMEDIEEILRPVSAPNPPRWPAGESPGGIVSGDLDGDDDLDLVVSEFYRFIRVFRNRSGDFESIAELPVKSLGQDSLPGARSLRLADFDGDGDLDLAAAILHYSAGGLLTYENRGDGSFEESVLRQSFSNALYYLELLDIDNDGDMDAAASSFQGRALALFENAGGELAPRDVLDVGTSSLRSAADWNADGWTDLFLATYDPPARVSLLSNVQGSFSEPVTLREGGVWTLTANDMDGDGRPDLIVSSDTVLVFENLDGALSEPWASISAGPRALSIHVDDLDADGRRDMALILEKGLISIVQQDEPGTFSHAGSYFAGRLIRNDMTTADFDGDGLVDLISTVTSSGTVALLRGRADGTLAAPRVVKTANEEITGFIGFAELTGDGSPDLIYRKGTPGVNSPVAIIIEKNAGDGTFSLHAELEAHFSQSRFELLDVDLDGDLDGARSLRSSGKALGIHENLGGGTFGPAEWFETGGLPSSLHVGDFNEDGFPDVLMGIDFPVGISVALNAPNGAFRSPLLTSWVQTSFSPEVFLLTGDFDGDDHLDALVGPYVENPTMFYRGKGTGRFDPPVPRSTVVFSYVAAPADLDKDGDTDVAAAELDSTTGKYELLVFANDGAADFSLRDEIGIPEGPRSILIADLNGDAAPEALVPCHGAFDVIDDGAVAVMMNDGAGGFSEVAPWLAGYRPAFAALGDIDGDGSHDLVVGAEGEHNGPPGELLVLDDVSRPASGTDADGDLILDACQSPPFHRGDANGDGDQDISDPLCVLNVLFVGRCRLDCLEAADANNDGVVDCSDAITILNWQFLGSEPPATPGPDGACGVDPDLRGAPGFLDCERYSGCDGA